MLARDLRIPRERTLFTIAAIFSSIVWLGLLILIPVFALLILIPSVIPAIIVVALLALFALVIHYLFMAHVIGNGVRVGPRQLPALMRRIESAAHKLGMDRVPEAYVLQAGGRLKAFATKILSRRFIVLYSDLVDAGDTDDGTDRPNELDFAIGRELGHLAAGHLATRLWLLPARIMPWLGPAYSRACEYTCDRCGHAVTGDLAVSSRALAILAAGPRAARKMDLDAYVDQRRESGRFWMAVYELNASRPYLSKRVAALRAWQGQGTFERVGRNPFSYLLAPLFGFASGSPQSAVLILVVAAGIAAAIAVPRIKQQMGAGLGGPSQGYRFDQNDRALDPLPPLPGDRTP